MEPYDIEEKLIKAARLFKGLADEKFGPTDNWSIPAMQFRRARNGNEDAKKSICLMVGAAVGLSTNEVAKIFDYLYGDMNENKRYKTATNNMKRTIKLTESDLHRVIKESVKRIVNETIFNDDSGDLCWEPAEDTKYSIGPEGSNGWPKLLNKDDGSETGYQIYGWEELPNNRRYSLWNSKTGNSHDRIPESRLRRVVRESVKRAIKESAKRILSEDERRAWELTDNGVDEFGLESGYPTRDTNSRYSATRDNDYIAHKIELARQLGSGNGSGYEFRQRHYRNKFAEDDPLFRDARSFASKGKFYNPYGFEDAEQDMKDFNDAERRRQSAADKRWQKAADTRPLHRKGSLNRD